MSDDQVETAQVLRDIYYSPTQGFRSAENIFQQAKKQLPNLTKGRVVKFLQSQKIFTQYKSHKGVKNFLPTYVRDFDQLQIDLVDFRLSKRVNAEDNDGYNYIVVAIEILSRFVFTHKLKKKDGKSTAEVVAIILEEFKDKFEKPCKIVQFDDSNEFANPEIRRLFKERHIETWVSGTKRKAAVVERFNRTLKEKMVKYFEHQGRNRWVDVLDDLTDNYNSQTNRSIGMPPEDVSEQNKHQVWMRLYGKAKGPIPKPKFEVGDRVRVLDYKIRKEDVKKWREENPESYKADKERRRNPQTGKLLARHGPALAAKHAARFSEEVFLVSEVKLGHPVAYKLFSDEIGDQIMGIFYERELSLYTGE